MSHTQWKCICDLHLTGLCVFVLTTAHHRHTRSHIPFQRREYVAGCRIHAAEQRQKPRRRSGGSRLLHLVGVSNKPGFSHANSFTSTNPQNLSGGEEGPVSPSCTVTCAQRETHKKQCKWQRRHVSFVIDYHFQSNFLLSVCGDNVDNWHLYWEEGRTSTCAKVAKHASLNKQ